MKPINLKLWEVRAIQSGATLLVRPVKQQPKAADWAYKWAVTLCEIAGAR